MWDGTETENIAPAFVYELEVGGLYDYKLEYDLPENTKLVWSPVTEMRFMVLEHLESRVRPGIEYCSFEERKSIYQMNLYKISRLLFNGVAVSPKPTFWWWFAHRATAPGTHIANVSCTRIG